MGLLADDLKARFRDRMFFRDYGILDTHRITEIYAEGVDVINIYRLGGAYVPGNCEEKGINLIVDDYGVIMDILDTGVPKELLPPPPPKPLSFWGRLRVRLLGEKPGSISGTTGSPG